MTSLCVINQLFNKRNIIFIFSPCNLPLQVTVTFLAIILLCLLVHCASFWLTEEHFRVLVGAQSAVSDVQFQLHASDHHLRTLAHTLSQQLQRLQKLCDAEVDSLTSVFFDTVNMQVCNCVLI